MSAGTGAISGKGMRDTMGLGKGVVVLVAIVGVLGSFALNSGEFETSSLLAVTQLCPCVSLTVWRISQGKLISQLRPRLTAA